jgi:hypothetical protein
LVVTEGKQLKWYKINEKWLVTCDFRLFLLPL